MNGLTMKSFMKLGLVAVLGVFVEEEVGVDIFVVINVELLFYGRMLAALRCVLQS